MREKLKAAAVAGHEEEKPRREEVEDRGDTSDADVVTGGSSTELDFLPLEINYGKDGHIYNNCSPKP